LKENVIMGRLIPAGTGLVMYRKLGIQVGDVDSEVVME
jgi:DNA-directed RNA polymerase subunit beta'